MRCRLTCYTGLNACAPESHGNTPQALSRRRKVPTGKRYRDDSQA